MECDPFVPHLDVCVRLQLHSTNQVFFLFHSILTFIPEATNNTTTNQQQKFTNTYRLKCEKEKNFVHLIGLIYELGSDGVF